MSRWSEVKEVLSDSSIKDIPEIVNEDFVNNAIVNDENVKETFVDENVNDEIVQSEFVRSLIVKNGFEGGIVKDDFVGGIVKNGFVGAIVKNDFVGGIVKDGFVGGKEILENESVQGTHGEQEAVNVEVTLTNHHHGMKQNTQECGRYLHQFFDLIWQFADLFVCDQGGGPPA